jgi:hypothetical protein
MSPLAALAQIPGGVQVPGTSALPSVSLPTKDGLLQQAKGMVTDLTAMKSSGKLAPAQVQQVDGLLPKATALTSDLQKPQIPTSKLAEYATTLSDLQKQVGMLKSAIK